MGGFHGGAAEDSDLVDMTRPHTQENCEPRLIFTTDVTGQMPYADNHWNWRGGGCVHCALCLNYYKDSDAASRLSMTNCFIISHHETTFLNISSQQHGAIFNFLSVIHFLHRFINLLLFLCNHFPFILHFTFLVCFSYSVNNTVSQSCV